MRIRSGVTVSGAVRVLEDIINRSVGPRNVLGGLSPSVSLSPRRAARPPRDSRSGRGRDRQQEVRARTEFWDRVRDLLALIDSYADGSADGYAQVRDGVTVEILPDEEGHTRFPDPDQEILDRCELLHQATDQTVTLVTGDSAARINARASGIEVFKLARGDMLPRYRPESPASTAEGE